MKSIAKLLILSSIIFSCEPGDDINEGQKCLLIKFGDSQEYQVYTFDSDDRLIKIVEHNYDGNGSIMERDYTYGANSITIHVSVNERPPSIYRIDFNEKNQVWREIRIEHDTAYFTYTDNSKEFKKIEYTAFDRPIKEFTWQNGNIVKIVEPETGGVTEMEFDNKINPFRGMFIRPIAFGGEDYESKNNVTLFTHSDQDGEVTQILVYSYNSKGYPVGVTSTRYYGDEEYVDNYSMEYNCID